MKDGDPGTEAEEHLGWDWIGYVDVAAGDSSEVLCISPWVPVVVNGGHECVVAQAISPADPLPTPLPDPIDPPN